MGDHAGDHSGEHISPGALVGDIVIGGHGPDMRSELGGAVHEARLLGQLVSVRELGKRGLALTSDFDRVLEPGCLCFGELHNSALK